MPTTDLSNDTPSLESRVITSNSRRQAVASAHLVRLVREGYADTGAEWDAKALYSQALKAGYDVKVVDDTAVKVVSEKPTVGRRFLVAGRIFSMADLGEYLSTEKHQEVSKLDFLGFVDFGDYARDDDALRVRRVA